MFSRSITLTTALSLYFLQYAPQASVVLGASTRHQHQYTPRHK